MNVLASIAFVFAVSLAAAGESRPEEGPAQTEALVDSIPISRERVREMLIESGAPADLSSWLASSTFETLIGEGAAWFRAHIADSTDAAVERQWYVLRAGIGSESVRRTQSGELTSAEVMRTSLTILARDPDAALALEYLESSGRARAREEGESLVWTRDVFERVRPTFRPPTSTWVERQSVVSATGSLLSKGLQRNRVEPARIRAFEADLIRIAENASEHPQVRRSAVTWISRLEVRDAIPALRRLLADDRVLSTPELAGSTCQALAQLGDVESREGIGKVYQAATGSAIRSSAGALAKLGEIESLRILMSRDTAEMPTEEREGVRSALREMQPLMRETLRSSSDEKDARLVLDALAKLGPPHEDTQSALLDFVRAGRFPTLIGPALDLLLQVRMDKATAVELLGTIPPTSLSEKQRRTLQLRATKDPIPALEAPDSIPGPKRAPSLGIRGNHSGKEVGDPSYRRLSKWALEWLNLGDLGHCGIFVGLDAQDVPRIIEVGKPIPHVVDFNPWDEMDCPEPDCWGTYALDSWNLTFSERRDIVLLADSLTNDALNIAYPIPDPDALNYSFSLDETVEIDEITRLRCDGLVEYCYERHGFEVWGPNGVSSNISDTCCVEDHADLYVPPGNPNQELAPVVQCGRVPGGYSSNMTEDARVDFPIAAATYWVDSYSGGADIQLEIETYDRSGIHCISLSTDSGLTWVDTPHTDLYPETDGVIAELHFPITDSQWVYFTVTDKAGNETPTFAVHVDIHDDDPAATVGGFAVIDGAAEWFVESEHQTARYDIEGAPEASGPWSVVTTAFPGAGARRIQLADAGARFYRLVEIEHGGRRAIHGRCSPGTRAAPAPPAPLDEASLRADLAALAEQRRTGGAPPRSVGERVVIITVDPYVADVSTYVEDYWEAVAGYDIYVASVGPATTSDPAARREALRSLIAFFVLSGTHRFHLVGDANDWQEFDGPMTSQYWVGSWEPIRQQYLSSGYPAGGQPALNQIPTYAVADTMPRGVNMSYVTPYYLSDQEYVAGKDAVITRWPVSSTAELLAIAAKMQAHNNAVGAPPPFYSNGLCYVGDEDFDDPGDGQRALQFSQNLVQAFALGEPLLFHPFLLSDYSPQEWAIMQAVNLWNTTPHLRVVAMVGSLSTRYRVVDIFDKENANYPFFVDWLITSPQTPLVLAASCSSADFARTERVGGGPIVGSTPNCEDFLFANGKGAIAWVGPTVGSWQNGNEAIATRFAEELVLNPERSMGDSWRATQERVAAELPLGHHAHQAIDSYVFLGDPFSPFEPPRYPVAAPLVAGPAEFALEPSTSNPFSDTIGLTLAVPQRSPVSLCVYDVRGRLVRTLHRGPLDSGRHDIPWNGEDDEGCNSSPGIYFVRAENRGRSLMRKIVRVR